MGRPSFPTPSLIGTVLARSSESACAPENFCTVYNCSGARVALLHRGTWIPNLRWDETKTNKENYDNVRILLNIVNYACFFSSWFL